MKEGVKDKGYVFCTFCIFYKGGNGCNLESIGSNRVISLKQNYYVNEKLKRREINSFIDANIKFF